MLSHRESVAVWAGTAAWVAGLAAAVVLTVAFEEPRRWWAAAVAAVAVGGLIAVAVAVGRAAMRREGVERTVNVEASALAFWTTMGAALTYTLIDSFADVPALRGPWVLGFGLVAWCVAQASRLERYR